MFPHVFRISLRKCLTVLGGTFNTGGWKHLGIQGLFAVRSRKSAFSLCFCPLSASLLWRSLQAPRKSRKCGENLFLFLRMSVLLKPPYSYKSLSLFNVVVVALNLLCCGNASCSMIEALFWRLSYKHHGLSRVAHDKVWLEKTTPKVISIAISLVFLRKRPPAHDRHIRCQILWPFFWRELCREGHIIGASLRGRQCGFPLKMRKIAENRALTDVNRRYFGVDGRFSAE